MSGDAAPDREHRLCAERDALMAENIELRAALLRCSRLGCDDISTCAGAVCQSIHAILVADPGTRGSALLTAADAVLAAVKHRNGKRERIDLDALWPAVDRLRVVRGEGG